MLEEKLADDKDLEKTGMKNVSEMMTTDILPKFCQECYSRIQQ